MTRVSAALLALLLAGCNTTYRPASIDQGTGLYSTTASVDPGGVIVGNRNVNLNDYGAVLMVVASNNYPARLEFVTRKALTDMGFKNIVDIPEFRRWAEDSKFELPTEINMAAIEKFSSAVKPVLIVDMRYASNGSPRHFGGLKVVDGRNGVTLLTVNHPKTVWLNTDDEVIYPVLNELRKWQRDVSRQGA